METVEIWEWLEAQLSTIKDLVVADRTAEAFLKSVETVRKFMTASLRGLPDRPPASKELLNFLGDYQLFRKARDGIRSYRFLAADSESVSRKSRREFERSYEQLKDSKWKETPQGSSAARSESIFQRCRGVIYGNLYDEGPPSEEDSGNSQRLVERRQFFASLGSVEELKELMFNMKQVLHSILRRSTSIEVLSFSVSEEFRSSLLRAVESRNWEEVESMVMPIAMALPIRAAIHDAFIVLASLLLSAIFWYRMALFDKGGTKTHSSGSREFRSRYISIELFQGAYVWIKFREVAPPSLQKPSSGLYRKCKPIEEGVKVYYGNFEPRFKPQGSDSYISVRSYETEEEARIVYQVLAFYYGKAVPGELPLKNGKTYPIPCMTEEEQRLDSESKKKWAKDKAKVVLEEFKRALEDSQAVQATGDNSNALPPDAGAGCDSYPVQLGNQADVRVFSSNFSPNVGPGIQVHVADEPCNAYAAAAGDVVSNDSDMSALVATFEPGYQEAQGTGHILNTFAGAGYVSHPVQPRNESGGSVVPVPPSNSSPDLGPGMQVHAAVNSRYDHAAGAGAGAGVSDQPSLDPHSQHQAFEENLAKNVNPDLSVLRLVKELQRQQQLQQIQIQWLESQSHQQANRIQQLESQNQQLGSRNSVSERNLQLLDSYTQQQASRISELEDKVELLNSTEPARKRLCVGLTLT